MLKKFTSHGGAERHLALFETRRQLSIMIDYQFGRGASRGLPKNGLEFVYSRRSERVRQVLLDRELFATVRPNGALALTVHAASILAKSKAFLQNAVTVEDEAVTFVKEGRSVFCKFVVAVGDHVLPGGDVVILDRKGAVIGVGRAKMNGRHMREFKAGAAVKVRGSYE